MAGKRQHFIPRFLQKGFASHSVGEEIFTWTYRKGIKPFNTNIKNVGVEGFFYSENHDTSLDDTITVAESDFAQLVDSIRLNNAVDKRDQEKIARLFAHLEVRTRHLRQSYFATGNQLLNKMLEYLSDPAFCERFIRRGIINDPSLIKDSFSKELRKRGISQEALPTLMELSGPFIESTMPNMLTFMAFMVAYLKKEMPARLEQASKTGHIRALNQGLSPVVKVLRFEKLNFKIVNSEDSLLPLGDSAVVFHVCGERSFKPILEKKDDLIALLLPIGSRQVIVGCAKNYVPDFSVLRDNIAGCSLEYFIANENTPENEILSGIISENSHLLTEFQMEELIDSIMNEKPSNKANSADAKSSAAD